MKAKFSVAFAAAAMVAACAAEGEAWFPFVISYGGEANASSVAHLLDAPAGKHGFVRVTGGEFVTDAGPIRFNGTNLTGPANFPEHHVADRLAARFARLGINCVRLHFMDTWYKNFMDARKQGILADDAETQRKLSPEQLEKLDYMIAAFKKVGVYVNINLHVGRTLDERDGLPGGSPWANKTVGQFMPRMVELQKEYARDLLTHVNRYTGNAYTDEPAVAMIEISNEDQGLVQFERSGHVPSLGKPFLQELERQWNAWLHAKYPSEEAIRSAWVRDAGTLGAELLVDSPKGGWDLVQDDARATCAEKDGVVRVDVVKEGARYSEYREPLFWLSDAMIVNCCYNATEPVFGLRLNQDRTILKCYMADTGLLVSHAFDEKGIVQEEVYKKLLLDKLEVNMGMVMENVVAQMLTASGHKLYFYTNADREHKENRMEIDFLIAKNKITNRHNISPIEVKSSKGYALSSLKKFMIKFNEQLHVPYVLHTGDLKEENGIVYLPLYMAMLL